MIPRVTAWLARLSRHDLLFLALFVALAVLRVALLCFSQYPLNGDDAAVGVMGQRILRGDPPPFASVADRHGGSTLVAYLAAASFALFGVSEHALKLVAVALSLAALTSVYLFVRAVSGTSEALICALLYGTTVSLIKWSFYAPGGYVLCHALLPAALWLLHQYCLAPGRAGPIHDLLLGTLCGAGVYVLEIFAPAALTALLLLVVRGSWRRRAARAAAFGVGLAAGAAPLFAFGRGLDEIRPLALAANLGGFGDRLWLTLTSHLPRMMAYENIEGFPPLRWLPNTLACATVFLGIAALLRHRGPALIEFWRARRGPGEEGAATPAEASLLAYVLVYLGLYSLHPATGRDARHLLLIEPALSILAGLGLHAALTQAAAVRIRWAAVGLVLAALLNRGWQHVRLADDNAIYGPRGTSRPETAETMIAFLGTRRVEHVITEDWDLAWRIVFRTEQRILACHALAALAPLLDDGALRRGRYAVLVFAESARDRAVARRLARSDVAFERHEVEGKAVYVFGWGTAAEPTSLHWCPEDARS